jgi:opacity protein-like surface antigen
MCRVLWPLVGVTLAAAPLLAQDGGVPLRINLSGTASAPVAAGGTVLGRANPGTPFTVLTSALNLGKGAGAGLIARTTGTETTLEVASADVKDDCDKDEACRFIIGFKWGETPDLALDPTLTYALPQSFWDLPKKLSAQDVESNLRKYMGDDLYRHIYVDAGYQFTSFIKAEDIAGDQPGIIGTSADKSGSGIRIGVGYQITPNLGVGVRYAHSGFSVSQQFSDRTHDHDVKVNSYEGLIRFRPLPDGPLMPYVDLGWGYFSNKSEIRAFGDVLGTRSQGGGRVFGGFGTNLRFRDRIWGDLGAGYVTGGSDDADTNWWILLGLTYLIGSGE